MTRGGRKPKLEPHDVELMRLARKHGFTADQLAHRFRVARSTVLRYLRGECRSHREAA